MVRSSGLRRKMRSLSAQRSRYQKGCKYAQEITHELLPELDGRTFAEVIDLLSGWNVVDLRIQAKHLSWRVMICEIWRERCLHIFQNSEPRRVLSLVEEIKAEFRSFAL
ncbi:hypothetical protein LINPERHAP1_LOCUS18429, partial [Linum perenne]